MSDDVIVERRGRLGLLTLERPKALNALTHEMVLRLREALEDWRDDDAVQTVAIRGAGERGLCAGGDVVGLRRAILDGDAGAAERFWRDEYALNAVIASYPKPYVAIQDGVVLGGGVGVSAHGSHRLVTERTRIGFPEVTIGFLPDVGGTWLLTRRDPRLGMQLALLGASVEAADAVALGLADRLLRSERIPELLAALEREDADTVVARQTTAAGPSETRASAAFDAEDAWSIMARLRAGGDEDRALAETIASRSPRSVAITTAALRAARELPSLEDALAMEFRLAMHLTASHDFVEGVRAQLVDKDRAPRWRPASLDDLTVSDVAAAFEEPAVGDLVLPDPEASATPADSTTDPRSTPVTETIVVETRGRVGWITLDRPDALNALNAQIMHEVVEAAVAFDADPEIGAIVVTGSAKAFAAGADIKEMEAKTGTEMLVGDHFGLWRRFAEVRTPVIAAVAGYALGGGCELAMMCDIIVAADTASFGQPEIGLGVIPGIGGTQRLVRAVGMYKAAEIVLTGRRIDAAEADRIGLVSRVVPADRLLEEVEAMATTMAARSLPALYAAKASLDAALESPLAEGLRFERHAFAGMFDTEDQKEGMAAFREKREPQFRHR